MGLIDWWKRQMEPHPSKLARAQRQQGLAPEVGSAQTPREFIFAFLEALFPDQYSAQLKQVHEALEQFPDYYVQPVALSAIKRYVDGEMDFTSPGKRGYGRMTEFVPRMGGWFRGELQRLQPEKRTHLALMITQAVCNGYALALLYQIQNGTFQKPPVWVEDELFLRWIPSIYVFAPEPAGFTREGAEFVDSWAYSTVGTFKKQFERDLGIKVGFLRNLTFSTLVMYYFSAGFCLRLVEMAPPDEEPSRSALHAAFLGQVQNHLVRRNKVMAIDIRIEKGRVTSPNDMIRQLDELIPLYDQLAHDPDGWSYPNEFADAIIAYQTSLFQMTHYLRMIKSAPTDGPPELLIFALQQFFDAQSKSKEELLQIARMGKNIANS